MFAAFGANMLNKLGENSSNLWGTGRLLKKQEHEDNRENYLFNEREGIQARVEGAKAAGLHPLAALGFQAGASPTTVISGTSSGDYGYRSPDPEPQQRANDPNIDRFNAARARREEAEADMAETNARKSRQALATQPGQAPPMLPTERENLVPSQPGKGIRGVKVIPNEIESSINGTTVGTHPGATVVKIPGYGSMSLPSKALSERLEDQDAVKNLITLGLNRNRLLEFITDDLPWAARGYSNDLRQWLDKAGEGYVRSKQFIQRKQLKKGG